MSKYSDVFPRKHTILPVVHVTDLQQAQRNTELARNKGADGVFLINHGFSADRLKSIFQTIQKEYSDWWIGINMLGVSLEQLPHVMPFSAQGIWSDCAGVASSHSEDPAAKAKAFYQSTLGYQGLFFGGLSFKGRPTSFTDAEAATQAVGYVDVITTSGIRTGEPPLIEKIRTIRGAIDRNPLAIASGISADNVHLYKPYADCFVVSSSIEREFGEFDPTLLRELIHLVHEPLG
jgi:uncharacterized protein